MERERADVGERRSRMVQLTAETLQDHSSVLLVGDDGESSLSTRFSIISLRIEPGRGWLDIDGTRRHPIVRAERNYGKLRYVSILLDLTTLHPREGLYFLRGDDVVDEDFLLNHETNALLVRDKTTSSRTRKNETRIDRIGGNFVSYRY